MPRGKKLKKLSRYGPGQAPFIIVSTDTVKNFAKENSRKQCDHLAINRSTKFEWVLYSRS